VNTHSSHDCLLPVLKFRNITVLKGKGSYIYEVNGNKILDVNSGQFCAVFGHSYSGLKKIVKEISKTIQDTDTSTISVQVLVAMNNLISKLPEMPGAKGIFLSTGGEANEFALKYAKHLKEKSGIISFDRGYHGLSHGTAAYSMSRDKIRPKVSDSYSVPVPISFDRTINSDYNNAINALVETTEKNHHKIAAMIFEPIVSGGGMLFPPKEYFEAARFLCDKYGIILIFDECQTGMGRIGKWFSFQDIGVVPDILVTSKAIGAGLPVSAVIMQRSLVPEKGFKMQYFSSHQNEPFAGSLVNFVLNTIVKKKLLKRNVETGKNLKSILLDLQEKYPSKIFNVRGEGMMLGFDLVADPFSDIIENSDIFSIEKIALEENILLQTCNLQRTVRILPNYFISKKEMKQFSVKLNRVLQKLK
jgi:2,2-dialkylglycine decarboxylase (pyruvate)